MKKISVVIPNFNGKDSLSRCIDSLLAQTIELNVIVVENGSNDGSLEFIQQNYPDIDLVINKTNLGFSGGVNSGIRKTIATKVEYIALFNNDAVADKNWAKNLLNVLENNKELGIVTSKILISDGKKIDSTGDFYTNWGLPYPRGRSDNVNSLNDLSLEIFAASGGASLYRASMLEEIGLFDEDFFAYYEDVDISFRAQLAGWKIAYVPDAIVYHQIGATSSKLKGFTTYQTTKNLPWIIIKNIPRKYIVGISLRLVIAQILFIGKAFTRKQGWYALKGCVVSFVKIPKKFAERKHIMQSAKVSDEYIWKMIVHDLPPNAKALRNLRNKWWKITRRKNVNTN